jgi:hypothetical protein
VTQQLTLDGKPDLVSGGRFQWSASRADSFKRCKRAYFYHYYGFRVDDEIKRLKKLSAMLLWVGNVVHDELEMILKTWKHMPDPKEQQQIIQRLTQGQMPQDFGFSKAGTKKFRLFEHEYDQEVTLLQKRVAVGLVKLSMQNAFAPGSFLSQAFAVGEDQWLTVEDLCAFEVDGHRAVVKMDLCFRDPDGKVVIVDWKTGRSVWSTNKAQIGGYALYAFRRGWAKKPEEISTNLFYLPLDKVVQKTPTWDDLKEAQDVIAKSSAEMKAALRDPDENVACIEDFPMSGKKWDCERCPFGKLCYPGGEL